MALRFVSLFVVLAVTLQNAYGISETTKSKMMNYALPLLMECAKEMEVTKETIEEMKEKASVTSNPCLIACYFRKAEVLDDGGMYLVENARKIAKEISEGESEDDIKELDEMASKCVSVNDKEVEDGAKGCDRALLLHECFSPEIV